MDDTRKENNEEGRLINIAITEEEKKRRRAIYNKNLNMILSDYDDEYIEWRLSHKTEEDYIYEKWLNGEIEFDELRKLINSSLNNMVYLDL